MTLTSAHVVGNLTRDPELRYTPNGTPVLSFTVAVNRRRKDGDQWVDGDPEFYNVTAWRDLATNGAESFEKGMRVLVVGRLAFRSWEDDEGRRRSVVELVAENMGPDITWATAAVTKAARRGPDSDRPPLDAYADDPGNRAPTPPAYDPAEEPF